MAGLNFQKQFDTITGALNLFDLSYLVSGAAMLGVVAFAYPECLDLMEKIPVGYFVVAAIFATYISGMISWVFGKNVRYWFTNNFGEKDIAKEFEDEFEQTFKVLNFQTSEVINIVDKNKDVAYTFMWQMLDDMDKPNSKDRFLFINRFWTLRAAYEGLILPFTMLAFTIMVKLKVLKSFLQACSEQAPTVLLYASYILIALELWFMFVRFLAKEARRCANNQITEVIVAYYRFVECEQNRGD